MNTENFESKFLIVLGGFSGFTLAFFGGFFVGNDIPTVLRNASIACVVGAFLMKGFSQLLISQILQASRSKQQQAQIRAQEEAAAQEKEAETTNAPN
tara:strand:- start:83538 stop:83828 length:291 start_codon:yes stop_codon:yes gene_type:complete